MAGDQLRDQLASVQDASGFRMVLEKVQAGHQVLAALQAARLFLKEHGYEASQALLHLARHFELPEQDPALEALLRFACEWRAKPFVHDPSLSSFLRYLDLFQEAGGAVPILSEQQLELAYRQHPGIVQLMTVHGAKGLEFSHVWVLRACSPHFPASYRESLFEFPDELRSSVAGDRKSVV